MTVRRWREMEEHRIDYLTRTLMGAVQAYERDEKPVFATSKEREDFVSSIAQRLNWYGVGIRFGGEDV